MEIMKGLIEMLQNYSIHFCLLFQRRDLFGIYESPLWASLVAQWLKKKKKKLPSNAKDMCLIPGLGRSPGEGNGNLLQYSCLGKSHRQRSLVNYSPWSLKSWT